MGTIKYRVGESFVDLKEDEVSEMLEKEEKNIEDVIVDINKKMEDIKQTLAKLKVELYGKFGRTAINLEEDI